MCVLWVGVERGVPQVERQARNQALLREVNERIAELSSRFEVSTEKQRYVCECSHTGCSEQVLLSAAEYARIRDDPATFLVLPGHAELDREEILVGLPEYLIVRQTRNLATEVACPDTPPA